jgi:hypothetical protein
LVIQRMYLSSIPEKYFKLELCDSQIKKLKAIMCYDECMQHICFNSDDLCTFMRFMSENQWYSTSDLDWIFIYLSVNALDEWQIFITPFNDYDNFIIPFEIQRKLKLDK